MGTSPARSTVGHRHRAARGPDRMAPSTWHGVRGPGGGPAEFGVCVVVTLSGRRAWALAEGGLRDLGRPRPPPGACRAGALTSRRSGELCVSEASPFLYTLCFT